MDNSLDSDLDLLDIIKVTKEFLFDRFDNLECTTNEHYINLCTLIVDLEDVLRKDKKNIRKYLFKAKVCNFIFMKSINEIDNLKVIYEKLYEELNKEEMLLMKITEKFSKIKLITHKRLDDYINLLKALYDMHTNKLIIANHQITFINTIYNEYILNLNDDFNKQNENSVKKFNDMYIKLLKPIKED